MLAFRGTESKLNKGLLKDAATDLSFFKTPLSGMHGLEDDPAAQKLEVHKGFLKAFNSVIRPEHGQQDLESMVRGMINTGDIDR